MAQPRENFENLLIQKGQIPVQNLDEFFSVLEPVAIEEMVGEWKGGYFPGNSKFEFFLKNYIVFKWYGKKFVTPDKVKPAIFNFLGVKFNIPGVTAIIRELNFRGKISVSMIYNYLPIIDNFRKIDDNTLMGIMEIKGKTHIYFYLNRMSNK